MTDQSMPSPAEPVQPKEKQLSALLERKVAGELTDEEYEAARSELLEET